MPNKKAVRFLGEHTVNLVITVIVLVFLIYLVVKVYGIFTGGSELKKAATQLEKIVEIVNRVKETGEESKVEIFPPKPGWSLMTFPFDFPQGECRGGKSCLCICENLECNSKSRKCEGFNFDVKVDEVYKKYVGSAQYSIPTEANYEVFNEALILNKPIHELKIFKEEDIIKIKGLEWNILAKKTRYWQNKMLTNKSSRRSFALIVWRLLGLNLLEDVKLKLRVRAIESNEK